MNFIFDILAPMTWNVSRIVPAFIYICVSGCLDLRPLTPGPTFPTTETERWRKLSNFDKSFWEFRFHSLSEKIFRVHALHSVFSPFDFSIMKKSVKTLHLFIYRLQHGNDTQNIRLVQLGRKFFRYIPYFLQSSSFFKGSNQTSSSYLHLESLFWL